MSLRPFTFSDNSDLPSERSNASFGNFRVLERQGGVGVHSLPAYFIDRLEQLIEGPILDAFASTGSSGGEEATALTAEWKVLDWLSRAHAETGRLVVQNTEQTYEVHFLGIGDDTEIFVELLARKRRVTDEQDSAVATCLCSLDNARALLSSLYHAPSQDEVRHLIEELRLKRPPAASTLQADDDGDSGEASIGARSQMASSPRMVLEW